MAHIVVLVHRDAKFADCTYFMRMISEVWQEQGHTVTAVYGPDSFVEADLAILHVDLTVVPDDHVEFIRRYPKVINARVTNISKRKVSANQVTLGDGYDGAVIVKTDRNAGGLNEAILCGRKSLAAKYGNAVRRRIHWSLASDLLHSSYPIFESAKKVPWPVWHNSNLIVEKFLSERMGEYYCLRSWVFLGDRDSSLMYTGRQPVVKGAEFIDRIPVEVPDELRGIRKDFGIDFGKFDYAIVDGRIVLYDINSTPTLGHTPNWDIQMPRVRHLAEGLNVFL